MADTHVGDVVVVAETGLAGGPAGAVEDGAHLVSEGLGGPDTVPEVTPGIKLREEGESRSTIQVRLAYNKHFIPPL